ncbi:MAG: hypothetical protein HKM03_04095 [Steroidobacteraceae bacterium]|nr:hypothetical protein [Steroidobacteraceae bacterium]
MTRDYKTRRPKPKSKPSGGAGILAALAIGIVIGGGLMYLKNHRPASLPQQPTRPRPRAHAPTATGAGATSRAGGAPGAAASAVEAMPAKSYDFYKILPSFEVVVPTNSKAVKPDVRPAPETRPGTYVIQAGSYKHFADADRIRAQLALQGVESSVQKVSVDKDTWHRIRIGPISNLGKLNRIRAILRKAHINALLIRVGN